MTAKLGIIAGGKDLPKKVIDHCRAMNRPYFVLAIHGQTEPDTVINTDHAWIHIGAIGTAIDALKLASVEEIVMVGPVHRPAWHQIRPDRKGAKWLARLATNAFGDDSLLRIIIDEIENEGFRVISSEDLIGKDILASPGILGRIELDKQANKDIKHGMHVAKVIGQADIGQSIIIQDGLVLGVEAAEGTSELIKRCKSLHREGPGGILIKVAKPSQDRRVDLPTIGPETIHLAHENKLRGIAIEAGSVQILHNPEVISLADQFGLFIVGIDYDSTKE